MLCSSGLIVVSLTGNVLTKQIHKTCMHYKFFLPTLVQTRFDQLINTDAICVTYRYMCFNVIVRWTSKVKSYITPTSTANKFLLFLSHFVWLFGTAKSRRLLARCIWLGCYTCLVRIVVHNYCNGKLIATWGFYPINITWLCILLQIIYGIILMQHYSLAHRLLCCSIIKVWGLWISRDYCSYSRPKTMAYKQTTYEQHNTLVNSCNWLVVIMG